MRRPFLMVPMLIASCTLLAAPLNAPSPVVEDDQYRSKVRILPPDWVAPADEAAPGRRDAYGEALMLRQLGYAHASRGELEDAIARLEQTLALSALAAPAEQALRHDLARLYIAVGRYQPGIEAFEAWLAQEPEPSAEALVVLASGYLALDRAADAAAMLARALELEPSAPAEWRRLSVHALARDGDYGAAATALEALIARAPDLGDDWVYVAELWLAAGHYARALVFMELALRQGLLAGESEFLRMAQLYLFTGLPDFGARLVEAGLRDGVIADRAEHWALAAELWRRAQDSDRAIVAFERAVSAGAEAITLLDLAALYAARERWQDAADAYRRALRSGELGGEIGRAWLGLGEARYRLGERRAAQRAFAEAAELGGVYRTASAWLDYLAALERSETVSAAPISPAPASAAAARGPGRVAVKEVPGTRLFYTERDTTVSAIPDVVARMVRELVNAARRERLELAGPLQFITHGAGFGPADPVSFQVAVAVRRKAPPRGEFRSRSAPAFRCAWRTYQGQPDGLAEAWGELEAGVVAAGHSPSGERRQIVLSWSRDRPEDSAFELQLGIQ